jgi:branched-chain amino acid transport system ATP-binding protein
MVAKDFILQINNLRVAYADGVDVLRGASLSVERGRLISIAGANGSGKTTLLSAISGMLRHYKGMITGGEIEFKGKKINSFSPLQIMREGIVHILEGEREFGSLTVEENLSLGAVARHGKPSKAGIEMIYDYFPALVPRKKNLASDCGIGELQMLAIGRALMAQPEIILLDEPYQRNSPILANELFTVIRSITRDKKITFIFIERNPGISFDIADGRWTLIDGKIYADNAGLSVHPATGQSPDKDFR